MILSEEQIKEFNEASKPLIKYLSENHHPHVTVIVTSTTSEILESSAVVKDESHLVD